MSWLSFAGHSNPVGRFRGMKVLGLRCWLRHAQGLQCARDCGMDLAVGRQSLQNTEKITCERCHFRSLPNTKTKSLQNTEHPERRKGCKTRPVKKITSERRRPSPGSLPYAGRRPSPGVQNLVVLGKFIWFWGRGVGWGGSMISTPAEGLSPCKFIWFWGWGVGWGGGDDKHTR